MPGKGAVVRLRGGVFKTIADGLTIPTGMTLGSDGALYVPTSAKVLQELTDREDYTA